MGTVVPMSKVEGSWTWLSGLCNITLTYVYHDNVVVIHMRMRITGKVQRLFPVSAQWRIYQLQDESC